MRRPTGEFLLIIDASSFIHRAFHAMPRLTRRSDGMETGAIAGFCNTMLKLFRLNWSPIGGLPSHGIILLDHRSKNWRHKIYPEYKAQRPPYDPDLEVQLPWIPKIAEAFGIPCLGMQGYEADDLIATYVLKAEEEDLEVVIASSDKDLGQLVADEDHLTIMYDAMKDKGPEDNEGSILGPAEIRQKFGVWPEQICDFLALTGDKVDNIPGVPGFGPKTASRLLEKFRDIETLLFEADWGNEDIPAKEAAKIVEYRRDIELSKRLAGLAFDAPVTFEIEDCRLVQAEAHVLRGIFMDLEFMHLLDKVDRPAKI